MITEIMFSSQCMQVIKLNLAKIIKELEIKKIFVLCRGKSLEKLKDIKCSEKYIIVFVNSIRDIVENKSVLNLVSGASFSVQYINNDQINIEKVQDLDKLNIKYIQCNKKKSDDDVSRQLLNLHKIHRLQDISYKEIFFIPENIEREKYSLKTNGMSCLGYMTTIDCLKDISVYGLDFFECDYFNFHVHTNQKSVKEYQPKKGIIAKQQFVELVRNNPGKSFKMHTNANFKEYTSIDNLEIF